MCRKKRKRNIKQNEKKNKKKDKMQQVGTYYSSFSTVDFSIKEKNQNNTQKIDVNLLKELLSIQGPSKAEHDVQMYILKWVYKNVPNTEASVDAKGNIFITKNTNNKEFVPAFAAHMDEVNSLQTGRVIIELENVLIGINPKTGKTAGCPGDKLIVSLCGNA